MRNWLGILFCIGVAVSACGDKQETATQHLEILIRGGLVLDGSGSTPFIADVGVAGDRVVFVGSADRAGVIGKSTIDATGLWITPGFIDMHSHAELDRDYGRNALPYLYQGITSVVLGVDGAGTANVAERLQHWRDQGIGVNGLLYVGHGATRNAILGHDDREPDAAELEAMRALVRKGMDEGAFGLSSGLFYVPGSYASTEEVITLGKVAAAYEGAIYDTHDRDLGAVYQGVGYDASVVEGIRIGEETGLRTIFSHYNLQGAHNYGRAETAAKYLNDARARGVDVWAAHHPYTATQSNLRSYTVPDWAAAGGHEEILRRFDDVNISQQIAASTDAMLEIRGGAEKILFVDPSPDLNGKTLAQLSAERELAPAETVQAILRNGNASVMNLDLYDQLNTRRLARETWMMTCTDGRTPRPDQPITHPRTYGAFPMKMRLFVFEEQLLAPEFVVRSFSGLAADFLRLPHRGYLRPGNFADIVVLDPDRYRDKATIDTPRRYAEGVLQLLVNGKFAVRDGEATGIRAGHALTRPE